MFWQFTLWYFGKKLIKYAQKFNWEQAYLVFTHEVTFIKGPIRKRRWIASNQSYDISAMKPNIEIKFFKQSVFAENRASCLQSKGK